MRELLRLALTTAATAAVLAGVGLVALGALLEQVAERRRR